ncbi:hypothetical protein [Bacillus clarus]|uniref:Uncharacterized protein n=1 Tax=Bacillus clarus TaxID=2338372 RepID=A0A090YAD3_9BACI|nr:hypothetical protein [Bacillus clarus]KFM95738.1 hypothetical protein DJ93_5615 [Bacillus clarus]
MFKSLVISAVSVFMLSSGGITAIANELITKKSEVAQLNFGDNHYCDLNGGGYP